MDCENGSDCVLSLKYVFRNRNMQLISNQSYQCRYCDVMNPVIMQNDKWFRYLFPVPQSESGLAIGVIFNLNTPHVR